jgi:hypothetical protein
MYIPLDNLYEWMSGVSSDILIYRFFPHGARNLGAIHPVNSWYQQLKYLDYKKLIPLVAHDQEPLDFDRYNIDWKELKDQVLLEWGEFKPNQFHIIDDSVWRRQALRNIGAVVHSTINNRYILLHSELRSVEVSKFENNVFVGAYWWSHGAISRDWYRYAQHDPLLTNLPSTYSLDFNVYSRAWQGTREYRLAFLSHMVKHRLDTVSRITFSSWDNHQHYQDHRFQSPVFDTKISLDHLQSESVASTYSAVYDVNHYRTCAIDVVLETLFDDDRLHLTEKVLRPIACGKPFLLAATYGSLEYLRGYGFKTFDGIINETYDTIVDSQSRIEAIIAEMSRLSTHDRKHQLYRDLHAIAQHNRQHFFSDAFADQLQQELTSNISTAVTNIKHKYQTGRDWIHERKVMSPETRTRLDYWTQMVMGQSSRQERLELLRWCRSNARSCQ